MIVDEEGHGGEQACRARGEDDVAGMVGSVRRQASELH